MDGDVEEDRDGRAERSGARISALVVGLIAVGTVVGGAVALGLFGVMAGLGFVRDLVADVVHRPRP